MVYNSFMFSPWISVQTTGSFVLIAKSMLKMMTLTLKHCLNLLKRNLEGSQSITAMMKMNLSRLRKTRNIRDMIMLVIMIYTKSMKKPLISHAFGGREGFMVPL